MANEINKVTPEVEAEAGAATETLEGFIDATEQTEADGKAQADAKAKADAKAANAKVAFPIADAMYRDADGNVVTAVNADGLLIAVPKPIKDADKKVLYAGFNSRKHIPLKKDNFAGIVEYILYQAFVSRVRAARLLKSAEEKEATAARISKFGDDETRKKVNKLAKMKEAIETLQKQLESDGVDLEDI